MKLAELLSLKAVGTSEGANKAWDTKGRGKKSLPGTRFKLAKSNATSNGFVVHSYVHPAGHKLNVVTDRSGKVAEWKVNYATNGNHRNEDPGAEQSSSDKQYADSTPAKSLDDHLAGSKAFLNNKDLDHSFKYKP